MSVLLPSLLHVTTVELHVSIDALQIMINVFSSTHITVSADTVAHRHQLTFCRSIIYICFGSLRGAAHACLFGGLGAAVTSMMPNHWGQFYEVMANVVQNVATTRAHYQICHQSEIMRVMQMGHVRVKRLKGHDLLPQPKEVRRAAVTTSRGNGL